MTPNENESRTTHRIELYGGEPLPGAIARAIVTAAERGDQVEFEFTGIRILVESSSSIELIMKEWRRGLSGHLGENPTVGPCSVPTLSAEVLANDAAIEAKI